MSLDKQSPCKEKLIKSNLRGIAVNKGENYSDKGERNLGL